MSFLDINLQLMPNVRQFILYRLENKGKKITKIPISPISGNRVDITDQTHWVTAQKAIAAATSFKCDGIGFVIDSGYWLLDIDHCRIDGAWSPLAVELCAKFDGAYLEVSCSGEGLHIIGRGQAPEHICRADELEFYTAARFVALTGRGGARGSMDFNAEHLLPDLVNSYFAKSNLPIKVDNAIHVDSSGDDDQLIQLMLGSKKNPFRSGGASFRDLWEGNKVVLALAYPMSGERSDGLTYDASSADAALAKHLAFWTGNNKERMKSLMHRSALVRDKWQRDDYIDRTISFACATTTNFYQGSTVVETQHQEILRDSDSFIEVNIADVISNPPNPPSFIIEAILPRGVLTLCGGHGGSGKSLLVLQAAVCIATGCPFMGKQVKKSRVIFYSAEDATGIIRYRLGRLCQYLGIDPVALSANLKILDATDNPTLYYEASNASKQDEVTQNYQHLGIFVRQFSPDVIIVDNASDTFDANENERRRVRSFIRELVRLGKPYNAAVLLIAHVDKQTARGVGNSEGYSGSTAWHNSARSRLFLTIKENMLVLEHQKSNWGKCAEPIYLKWTDDGLLEHIRITNEQDIGSVILCLIDKYYRRGDYLSPRPNSPNNPFKMLQSDPEFPVGLPRDKLITILKQLEDNNLLERETYVTDNRKSRLRYKVAPSTPSHYS